MSSLHVALQVPKSIGSYDTIESDNDDVKSML